MWGFRFLFFSPLSIRYTHPSVFFFFFLRQKQTARKTFILSALFFWPPLDLSPLLSCGPYGMPGGEVSCPGPQQPYMEVTRHVYGLLYSMGPAQTGRCNLCLAYKSKHEPPFPMNSPRFSSEPGILNENRKVMTSEPFQRCIYFPCAIPVCA